MAPHGLDHRPAGDRVDPLGAGPPEPDRAPDPNRGARGGDQPAKTRRVAAGPRTARSAPAVAAGRRNRRARRSGDRAVSRGDRHTGVALRRPRQQLGGHGRGSAGLATAADPRPRRPDRRADPAGDRHPAARPYHHRLYGGRGGRGRLDQCPPEPGASHLVPIHGGFRRVDRTRGGDGAVGGDDRLGPRADQPLTNRPLASAGRRRRGSRTCRRSPRPSSSPRSSSGPSPWSTSDR